MDLMVFRKKGSCESRDPTDKPNIGLVSSAMKERQVVLRA